MSSFRSLPAAVVFLVCMALSVVTAWVGHDQLARRAGEELALAARLAASRIEAELVGRMRALESAAGADVRAGSAEAIAARRAATLAALARLHPELDWIGFVETPGRIVASHRLPPDDADVSGRDWWIAGLRGPHLGSTHDAADAQGGVSSGRRPLAFAVPLRDAGGTPHGVLAARLDADWVLRLRDAVRDSLAHRDELSLLVLMRDGSTVSGRSLSGVDRQMPEGAPAPGAYLQAAIEGVPQVLGMAPIEGDVVVSRLGWTVIVGRPKAAHFEHARAFAAGVLAAGAFFGGLGALALARALRSRPAP